MKLSKHPRLYLNLSDLPKTFDLPFLQDCNRIVATNASEYAKMQPLKYTRKHHNEHLGRAREVQGRVVTLLVRWSQTGQEKFRNAAMQYVRMIGDWEYWSWITWRDNNAAPDAIFDLSYGENSATLAIAYDCLYDTLSDDERALFLKIARERPILSGLKHCKPGAAWWFGKAESNWNTVCAGGLGMLVLAMYEDVPEAGELLAMVEKSFTPYMKHLDDTNGAWPEGIGYWNYGMRYAFMYLLSREAATGKQHPLMKIEGVKKTMSFPLDFCPNGQPCSFGDVNSWQPLPFHYATAARLGRTDIMHSIDSIASAKSGRYVWPNAAEWLALHPDKPPRGKGSAGKTVAKLYEGLDWGVLSDRMPDPSIYMAIRGGSTKVPHGQQDLLSFNCVIGREKLLAGVNSSEYLDTTFSPRRNEIFEISPASKNTLFINGVGITAGSELDSTELVKAPSVAGFRLNATSAMGMMRDGKAAEFCGRLILMLQNKIFVIVDRAKLAHPGRLESRMHTQANASVAKSGAVVKGEKQRLRVAYACNVPAVLLTAVPAQTTPTAPAATTLRWCVGSELFTEMTMATLLSPGAGRAKVELAEQDGDIVVKIDTHSVKKTLRLTDELRLV